MKRFAYHLCAFLLPIVLASCATNHNHGISVHAYKRELVRAIKKADRIEVIEHSDLFDARSTEGGTTMDDVMSRGPYFEYGRADLSVPAKQAFLASVQAMDPGEPHGWTRCLFRPHHTMRFYKGDEVASTMRICFACSQVEWLGDLDARPDALPPILADTVKSCGFTPDRGALSWAQKFENARKARREAGITHAPSLTGVSVRL